MIEIITRSIIVLSALLVPLLLLAGFVWVIIHPLSLDEVERRRGEAADAPRDGDRDGDSGGDRGGDAARPEGPRGPRRAA